MEEGLARGKFEVAESKIKAYKAKKTKEASSQPQQPLISETAIKSSPLTYSDLAVGVQLLAAVSAVSHDRVTLDLPFGMQAIADPRSDLTIGQFLPVVVVSVTIRGSFREVRVSLDPSVLNAGLKPEKRMFLTALIKSVEAHGYSLTFNSEISGFLPCSAPSLKPGCLVAVSVAAVPRPTFIEASLDLSTSLAGDRELKLNQVRVGYLVHCRVVEVLDNSSDVVVSFLRSLTGIVNRQYFRSSLPTKGATFPARVVAVDRENHFRLSPLDAHVGLQSALSTDAVDQVLTAKVKQVVTGQYAVVTVPDGTYGLCHFSRGGKTMKVEEAGGRKVKVLSVNQFEQAYVVSGEKKVVETELVSVKNVQVGKIYTGAISQVDGEQGLIVALSEFISGRVPSAQLFDVVMKKKNLSQFQKGAKIRVKVLGVDVAKRQVLLTAKKTMVGDEGKMIVANSEAEKGDILVGYIRKKNTDNTCFVNFYGEAYGVVKGEGLEEGATVKVKVVGKKGDEQPLKLSLDLGSNVEVEFGKKVLEWRQASTGVEVKLDKGWLQAKMVDSTITTTTATTTSVVVVGVEADGTLVCTGKSWVSELPAEAETVRLAYVTKVAEKCVFVSLGPWKTQGVILAKDMGDVFVEDAREVFKVGQTVVVKIKEAGKKFTASLRKKDIAGNAKYGECAEVLLNELMGEKAEICGRRITKFRVTGEKSYGKLFAAEEWAEWTMVAVNENIFTDVSEQGAELVVLDAMVDKKVLEVAVVAKNAEKKRKASEFKVRLNTKDQYAVVLDEASGAVGVFARSKVDKEAKLAVGAAVRLRQIGNLSGACGLYVVDAEVAKKKAKVEAKLEVGDAVERAAVKTIHGFYADLEVSGVHNKVCRVHFVDYPEAIADNEVLENLVVLEYKRKNNVVWLGKAGGVRLPEKVEELAAKVDGVVIGSSLKGVFVAISRTLTGRIPLKAIKPRPQSEDAVISAFPVGARLVGLTPEVGAEGQVSLALADQIAEAVKQLVIGNVVRGVVRGKKKYGIFVEIENTKLTALCLSNDCGGPIAMDAFQLNQAVVMEISKVENNKIWGAIANQSALVASLEDEEAAELVDESDSSDSSSDVSMELEDEDSSEASEDLELEEASDDEELEDEEASDDKELEDEDASDEEASEASDELIEEESEASESSTEEDEKMRDALEDEEEKKRKKKKVVTKVAKEEVTESPDEFEKRLIGEGPGSAEAWQTWTQYAGYYVRLGEVEQARRVLRRGLDAAQTEEGKFELFVVWMNMEANFGDKVEEVFGEAVRCCDSKKTHKAVCGVWRRSKNWAKEKKALELLIKKHNRSRKAWLLLVERLFDEKLEEEGRKTAQKAMRIIEEHKKVRFNVKLAIIEISHDFVERGVTVFEELIAKNPKKTDIWNVYIDQLTKISGSKAEFAESVRAVLRRACGLKLKPQGVLAFFKKWLAFEEQMGDADAIAQVQLEAQKYVTSQ